MESHSSPATRLPAVRRQLYGTRSEHKARLLEQMERGERSTICRLSNIPIAVPTDRNGAGRCATPGAPRPELCGRLGDEVDQAA